MRWSTTAPTVVYIASMSGNREEGVKCPEGYHWASYKEYDAAYRETGITSCDPSEEMMVQLVYASNCGWSGSTFNGIERRAFETSDGYVNNALACDVYHDVLPRYNRNWHSSWAGKICIESQSNNTKSLSFFCEVKVFLVSNIFTKNANPKSFLNPFVTQRA